MTMGNDNWTINGKHTHMKVGEIMQIMSVVTRGGRARRGKSIKHTK